MLKLPNDNPRCNADAGREARHGGFAKVTCQCEIQPGILGDQEIACPLIGLKFLLATILKYRLVDEDAVAIIRAMEDQVGRFVAEGEPNLITGLVTGQPKSRIQARIGGYRSPVRHP